MHYLVPGSELREDGQVGVAFDDAAEKGPVEGKCHSLDAAPSRIYVTVASPGFYEHDIPGCNFAGVILDDYLKTAVHAVHQLIVVMNLAFGRAGVSPGMLAWIAVKYPWLDDPDGVCHRPSL